MSTTYGKQRIARGKATIAQLNAGLVIAPGIGERSIIVNSASCRAIGGAVTAVTTIDLQSTNGTPVVAATFAQAQLTQNTLLEVPATGTTMGAGWNTELGLGDGLKLIKNGVDIATATHVEYIVGYTVV